jgi:hypothetical protein
MKDTERVLIIGWGNQHCLLADGSGGGTPWTSRDSMESNHKLYDLSISGVPRFLISLDIMGDHGLLGIQGWKDPVGDFEEVETSQSVD